MKLRGSLLVIVCCLMVEFVNVIQKRYILFPLPFLSRLTGLTVQGLLFLLYPLPLFVLLVGSGSILTVFECDPGSETPSLVL